MTNFEVVASSTGHSFGVYKAETAKDAIQAMLDDAGHDGPADADIVANEVAIAEYRFRGEENTGETVVLRAPEQAWELLSAVTDEGWGWWVAGTMAALERVGIVADALGLGSVTHERDQEATEFVCSVEVAS